MVTKILIILLFMELTLCEDTTIKKGSKSEKYCSSVLSKHFPLENSSSIIQEFPYMVAISVNLNYKTNQDKWTCTGILISEKFVLTTAYCLEINKVNMVRLGDTNLESDKDDGNIQVTKILKTFKHPEYDAAKKYNDLALIELLEPITITKYVRPACLETKRQQFYYNPVMVSWGLLSINQPKNQLQKHTFIEYDSITCGKYFNRLEGLNKGILYNLQICAGPLVEPEKYCQVEQGSSLQKLDSKYGYRIIGVASFGKCGSGAVPSVFGSVANSITWIESVVWP